MYIVLGVATEDLKSIVSILAAGHLRHRDQLRRAVPRLDCSETKAPKAQPDLSDGDIREILVRAMAEVGADPALVYAFQKTGVYVCEENEKVLPKSSLKAHDGAVDEYFSALDRPVQ
jgi:hypothetical protein